MNDTPEQLKPRVKWLLVWAAFVVLWCPIMSLIFSVIHPVFGGAYVGAQAVGFATCWTFLLSLNLQSGNQGMPQTVRKMKFRKEVGYAIIFCLIFFIGTVSHIFVGRPSWKSIIIYAMAVPASAFLADFLARHSGLVEAQRAVREAMSAEVQ